MYQKILVPLDGSDISENALPHAAELARRFNAELIVFEATTPLTQVLIQTAPTGLEATTMAPENAELAEEAYEGEKEAAEGNVARAARSLEAQGLRVRHEVLEGSPADAILGFAGREGVDLIVMCTHGRGGLERLVFGSVADEVIRNSAVPVMLIRPPRGSDGHAS